MLLILVCWIFKIPTQAEHQNGFFFYESFLWLKFSITIKRALLYSGGEHIQKYLKKVIIENNIHKVLHGHNAQCTDVWKLRSHISDE